jgi:diacylglycerol kinase (ATP)
MPESWVLIANPTSGRGKRRHVVEQVAARLHEAGRNPDLHWTDRRGHAEELARIAVAEGATHVVACGGDGTIHEVVNGMMAARNGAAPATLGIVPLGRCNDLAHTLRMPITDLSAIVELLLGDSTRVIDLGRVNDVYYTTVATLGFDSVIAQYVADNKHPKIFTGTTAYLYGTLANVFRYKAMEIKVQAEGVAFEGGVFLAATGNTATYGGKMKIVPPAHLDDGHLDLCLVRDVPPLTVLSMLPKVFYGGHVTHPRVSLHTLTRMEVTSPQPIAIWADGEACTRTPAVFQVAPKAMRVLAPL